MPAGPLQNRVSPLGELIADPGRGLVYGNRGCLHDADGRIRRHHAGRRWIACRLEFRGWLRRPLLQPGRFTELFFLDEATAMAAGHRACALCRREDYVRLGEIWRSLHPRDEGADAIDATLHRERWDAAGRARRLHEAALAGLPDGTFVLRGGRPCLVAGDRLLTWSAGGYAAGEPRPAVERAAVITPPSLVEVLRAGWRPLVPLLHPSARATSSSRPRRLEP
jgi:PAS domain-containing protein